MVIVQKRKGEKVIRKMVNAKICLKFEHVKNLKITLKIVITVGVCTIRNLVQ